MPRDDPMALPWLAWVLINLVSFLGLELFGYIRYGRPGTLSAHIQDWSSIHPLVPFGLGVVVGLLAYHFWRKQ